MSGRAGNAGASCRTAHDQLLLAGGVGGDLVAPRLLAQLDEHLVGPLAVLHLADAALEALLAVLPLVVGEPASELLDTLLVRLLGVEGAVRAAAVVRAALDDALAAGPEDAGPGREQPGQVNAEDLV